MDWYEKDPIFGDLYLQVLPQRYYGCIWAETKGAKRLSKRIDIEVCGSEELVLTPPVSESYTFDYRSKDQVISGYSFRTTDITSQRARMQVKYPLNTQCSITQYEITPGTDTVEYQIQATSTQIAVRTET